MSSREQFLALATELESLKGRVRNLIHSRHWQTDGEWKELVVREMLNRHLPRHFEPLRGFVTNREKTSSQIDVLVYNSQLPALFRSGDLVFVTPDAAAFIVEVKSTITSCSKLDEAASSLASNVSMIRNNGNASTFAGLFAFDTSLRGKEGLRRILGCLQKVGAGDPSRTIDVVCLGKDLFVLNWEGANELMGRERRKWHAYDLEGLAAGYFVTNIIHFLAPDSVFRNVQAWFPQDSESGVLDSQRVVHSQDDLGYGVVHYGGKAPGL